MARQPIPQGGRHVDPFLEVGHGFVHNYSVGWINIQCLVICSLIHDYLSISVCILFVICKQILK